jgi:hypothetical protein
MKKQIAILLMFLMGLNFTFSQKSEVYNKLKSSIDYGKKAKEFANSTLNYVEKYYHRTSSDDVKSFIRNAKTEIDNANSKAASAESDADDAGVKANKVNCGDAGRKANDADGNFRTVKSRFDDAYAWFDQAQNEENIDDSEYKLRKAKSYVEDGIQYLNSALRSLNEAIAELNDCN